MRRVALTSVSPGTRLARSIIGEKGELLLSAGTELTANRMRLLRERGCFVVYVDFDGTEDIEITETIGAEVHSQGLKAMQKMHEFLESAVEGLPYSDESSAIKAVHSRDFARATNGQTPIHILAEAARSLVDAVLSGDTALGLNSIRLHDNYTFDHSIHVAVTAVMLGRALGLDMATLESLATGCLLHDTGKVFIDRAILNKPGQLSEAEMAVMRRHAQLGYEAVKQIYGPGVLSNHVPYQHHERQDGTGYPRGLCGSNTLPAGPADRRGPGNIILIAEIASIADVYDALNSDRPYRLALPAADIIQALTKLRGHHLNSALVDSFLKLLAPFPVGSDVMVTGGDYDGAKGVVARQHTDQLERPVVRVLYDRNNRRVTPFDLDMKEHGDAELVALLVPPEELGSSPEETHRRHGEALRRTREAALAQISRPDVC